MKKSAAVAIIAALVALVPVSAAHAVTYGVRIFISAPDVQGPPMSSDRTIENFDGVSTGACPGSITAGTITGDCNVYDAADHGGASSDSGTPSPGGVGTRFPATDWAGANEITITLTEPQKYLGFWWSAGNAGNTVAFYSNDELVASMDTSRIMNKLAEGNQVSVGGSTYLGADYNGNPVNGAGTEAYVFLSLYAQGGTSFDKIVLSGGGFEFDNLTTSTIEHTPDDSLVEVAFIEGLVVPEDYVDDSSSGGSNEKLAATGFDASIGVLGALALIGSGATLAIRRRARR